MKVQTCRLPLPGNVKLKLPISIECYVCHTPFSEKYVKVRDHCHITGKYRGVAHQSCNLNLRLTKKIPVVFHNL